MPRRPNRRGCRTGRRTAASGAPSDVPDGADRVRLRARDDRTDDGGWIALTGPRVVDVLPLSSWLAQRRPVLVDWAVALAWPCAGTLPRVAAGVAATPGAFVTTPTGPDDPVPNERNTSPSPPGDIVPERWTGGTDGLATGTDSAASFAGLLADGSLREVDTRLPDEPGRRWGRVLVPELGDLDTDAYDSRVTTRTIPGTAGDRWAPPS
jgi:arabinosyltransferase C